MPGSTETQKEIAPRFRKSPLPRLPTTRSASNIHNGPQTDSANAATGRMAIVDHSVGNEQSEIRAALDEREELYRTIVAQANDAITLIDTETFRFVEFNDAACQGLGYTREEFATLRVPDIQAEMDAETLPRRLPPIVGDVAKNLETTHRHKDGSLRNVLVNLRGIERHGHCFMVAVWSDITERSRAERNLNMAMDVAQVVPWELDFNSGQLLFDKTKLPILGLQDDDSSEYLHDWIERIHADDARQFVNHFNAALQPGNSIFDCEYRIRGSHGNYRWVHTQGTIIQRSKEGQPERAVGTTTNIAAHKQIEEALRVSEANFRVFFDTIDDFAFVLDGEGTILRVNRTVIERLGYSEHDLIGRSVLDMHPADRHTEAETIIAAILAGEQEYCSVPLVAADGRLIAVETRVVWGSWNGVAALFGVSRDITDRLRIQEALEDEVSKSHLLFERLRESEFFLRESQRIGQLGGMACRPHP